MAILKTGGIGIPLKDIINQLGNKDYSCIMYRTLWEYEGKEQDDLFGYCKYENGILEPLDSDTYSLDDLYIKWEEWVDTDEEFGDNGAICLTVWEQGYYTE